MTGLSAAVGIGAAVLKRIPIRLKLVLLAGVPVIGALILATIIAREARQHAESAAAIGSIEDLARLSGQMARLVHALQFERNELSLRAAQKSLEAPELKHRFNQTDEARKQLREFLAARKVSSLPPRLARDLKTAEEKLNGLQKQRSAALSGEQPIDELLGYYKTTDLSLISATAALSQLAEDGELLRAISALVIVLQIKERTSQEHALLSHVFAINEFPPGTYKDLVTLTTEEAVYVDTLSVDATDDVNRRFKNISRRPEFTRTAELRKLALETMSDDFRVAPEEWSRAQGNKVEHLRGLEVRLNEDIKAAAVAKVAEAARSVRFSYGFGGGVILLSALLAGFIARGISRSVASLSRAAEQVSRDQDFGIRAVKTSEDELGRLTDTWNEMLSGIQARDAALRHHQENLERLVEQRTLALQTRNEAMRLVLDNVEQGLATIELDGTVLPERSRAFDEWFGAADAGKSFAEQLACGDAFVRDSLQVGWEQVTDGFFPIDAAIEQLPRQIEANGRRYDLGYKPILEGEALRGALLVVSDVTNEVERLRRDAEQRELIAVFERIMRDRGGFNEFFNEAEALVEQVARAGSPQAALRALHTLKGNCSIFGVESVAAVAHGLETWLVESGSPLGVDRGAELTRAWQGFAGRVLRLSAREAEPVLEITYEELRELEQSAEARAPHAVLSARLKRLKYERGVVRLRRIAEQAKSVAERLGKGDLDLHIEAKNDVRFQAEHWAPFWSSFVHVVRNAVDHGIEAPEARQAAGKPERPKLTLVADSDAKALIIEIRDDGRGIDWGRVREKAQQAGLPSATEQDLVEALFCDGLSTAESVTEVSGRGVGMSAVRHAARQLGGVVSVTSTRGVGTTVRFRFPISEATRGSETTGHAVPLRTSFPPAAE
jgi:two-component system, chemotaxis family, sensor kinase CheA